MKKVLPIILMILILLNAGTLFEIKDASNHPVFSISDDGLRVFNLGDTLMVISSSEIKAFIDVNQDKALSRSFAVSSSASKDGKNTLLNAFDVTPESAEFNSNLGKYTEFIHVSR